jgi:hypothetical protein
MFPKSVASLFSASAMAQVGPCGWIRDLHELKKINRRKQKRSHMVQASPLPAHSARATQAQTERA